MSNHGEIQEPKSIKTSVEQQFSQVAANYSTSAVHASGVELLHMIEVADLKGNERVLDAGCGAGHTALAFAPHVAEVVAMDLSDAMLEQVALLAAERQIDNITLTRGDVENMPFSDNEFDLVVSRYSAHHWPDPQRALREILRVMDKHGQRRSQFILADIVSSDIFTVDTYVQAIELLRDPSHVRDHTTAQWMAMLSGASYGAELVYEWDVRLDFDSWTERMRTPEHSVIAIRSLMDGAPEEVRSALRVEPDHTFTFTGAVVRGLCCR
jgi:ubiquinone/menaquinone biosynthesis C-methylase UbiE